MDPAKAVERPKVSDPFADKIVEWIDLVAGQGARRCGAPQARGDGVSGVGAHHQAGRRRVERRLDSRQHRRGYKPWIPEPGLWLQWDYGNGPTIAGVPTQLFCAWLAWSRFPGDPAVVG